MNKEHDDCAQRGIAERGESDPIAHHVFPPLVTTGQVSLIAPLQ
jgi:hypothetical protein